MIRSLSRRFPRSHIVVSTRTAGVAQQLSTTLENVRALDNQAIVDQADVIFVCLRAEVARTILPDLRFAEHHRVISVMAGMPLEEVSALIAPAENPCVTLPTPFIEVGQCPLPVYPPSQTLSRLFGDENEIIRVENEAGMTFHFAATAVLSTLMTELNLVSHWLSEQTKNKTEAERYIATLVSGYLNTLPKDGQGRFTEAIQELSTEGGLNTRLLHHNDVAGLFDIMRDGLDRLLMQPGKAKA